MIKKRHVLLGLAITFFIGSASVSAAVDTEFTQTINSGTLTTEILDENGDTVAAPNVPFSTVATSATCQVNASTGLLGTNTQRLYINNPGAAAAGWSLSMAATGGASAEWQGTGANTYSYNDATNGGCDDGQLSVDASDATSNLDCSGTCSNTGVTFGAMQAFASGSTDAVNLVNAAANSDDIWRGYLTGVEAMQTIPPSQNPDDYSIDMTVTAVAL